jgi:chaperonin GroES
MAKNAKKMTVMPLADRVLLKPQKEEAEKRASGIYIPESAQKDTPEYAEVLAVGEGKRTESGQLIPLRVKVGDIVMFSKYMGTDTVKIDGEEFFIVSEAQILAIIK